MYEKTPCFIGVMIYYQPKQGTSFREFPKQNYPTFAWTCLIPPKISNLIFTFSAKMVQKRQQLFYFFRGKNLAKKTKNSFDQATTSWNKLSFERISLLFHDHSLPFGGFPWDFHVLSTILSNAFPITKITALDLLFDAALRAASDFDSNPGWHAAGIGTGEGHRSTINQHTLERSW